MDDEIGARESLKMVFKDDYEVLLAKNAEEAFRQMKDHAPDVILLDILLPGFGWVEGIGADETGRPRCDRHYDHRHSNRKNGCGGDETRGL